MPSYVSYIDNDPNSKVELSWRPGFNGLKLTWKDFLIKHNGRLIGEEEDALEALRDGKEYKLPDGSTLGVRIRAGFQPVLQVTHNGKPLAAATSSGFSRVRQARNLLFLLGGFNVIFPLLQSGLSADIFVLGYGLALLACAMLCNRLPFVSLLAGAGLVAMNAVLLLLFALPSGANPVVAVLANGYILYLLYRGIFEARTSRPQAVDVSV